MLIITNNQRDANQNHKHISTHTCHNGYHQKDHKLQVLASIQRTEKLCALLRLLIGATELKHPIKAPGNVKNMRAIVVVVQLLSRAQLFVTPWAAASQAPLSSTVSGSLLIFLSTELVMLPNPSILCHSPSPFGFSLSQYQSLPKSQLLASGGQTIGASTSTSVFPMNI